MEKGKQEKKSYEELVYELQTATIGYLNFVQQQTEIDADYRQWCADHQLQRNDTTAELFIMATEKAMMDSFAY